MNEVHTAQNATHRDKGLIEDSTPLLKSGKFGKKKTMKGRSKRKNLPWDL